MTAERNRRKEVTKQAAEPTPVALDAELKDVKATDTEFRQPGRLPDEEFGRRSEFRGMGRDIPPPGDGVGRA